MKTRLLESLWTNAVMFALALGSISSCAGEDAHGEDDAHQHADDELAHAEEDHVELTEQQFVSAGIQMVEAAPGTFSEVLTLTGSIAPDADAVIHVTPRVEGRVRAVFKHLGEPVEPGELLCVIDSVELGGAVADYLRDQSLVGAAEETLERESQMFAARLEALRNLLDGAIEVHQRIFDRESELQERAVSTIRPLLEAEKALKIAQLERDKQIAELEAERDARLLALEVGLRARQIDLSTAANRLAALGVEAKNLGETDQASALLAGKYEVRSTSRGVVVDRHVSIGEFVEAGSQLYIIEDLSEVWLLASAFEDQLPSVRLQQRARIRLDAFPGTVLSGDVSFLGYEVDPVSRTVGVRISLPNERIESWEEDLPLRPGMFGTVELETTTRPAAVLLPEKALVHDDHGDSVFVQVEPFGFAHREVEVAYGANGMVEILSGLEAGEQVVVEGTFFLKSATRQAELGGGHSH